MGLLQLQDQFNRLAASHGVACEQLKGSSLAEVTALNTDFAHAVGEMAQGVRQSIAEGGAWVLSRLREGTSREALYVLAKQNYGQLAPVILEEACAHATPEERQQVVEVMERFGEAGFEQLLRVALRNDGSAYGVSASQAAEAVVRLDCRPPTCEEIALMAESAQLRDVAGEAVRELLKWAVKLDVEKVCQVFRSGNANTKIVLARSIHVSPERAEGAVPDLIEALSDSDAGVRMASAAALGGLGPKAKAAIEPLIRVAESKSEFSAIRDAAACALRKIDAAAW